VTEAKHEKWPTGQPVLWLRLGHLAFRVRSDWRQTKHCQHSDRPGYQIPPEAQCR